MGRMMGALAGPLWDRPLGSSLPFHSHGRLSVGVCRVAGAALRRVLGSSHCASRRPWVMFTGIFPVVRKRTQDCVGMVIGGRVCRGPSDPTGFISLGTSVGTGFG